MKNSALKNFNFKKVILIALIFALGLSFASFFAVINSTRVEKVFATDVEQAQDIQEQIPNEEKTYNVQLGESSTSDKISILSIGGNSATGYNEPTFIYKSGYNANSKIDGGSYISITWQETSLTMTISQTTNLTDYILIGTITAKTGYKFTGYTINGGAATTANINLIDQKTIDELDSTYTGAVTIKPVYGLISYEIDFYHQSYDYSMKNKTVEYNVEKSIDANTVTLRIDERPLGSTLSRWAMRKSALDAYIDYMISYTPYPADAYSGGIVINDGGHDTEFRVNYSGIIEFNGDTYYLLDTLAINPSYGDLWQDPDNPLIVAYYENMYTATIDNSGNYNDIYWKQQDLVNSDTTLLYGVARGSDVQTDKTLDISIYKDTPATFMTSYDDNLKGLAFSKQNELTGITNNGDSDSSYYVYNYGHYIAGWEIKVEIGGETYYANGAGMVFTKSDDPLYIGIDDLNWSANPMGYLAEQLNAFYVGKTGFPTVTLTPKWEKANIYFKLNDNVTGGVVNFGYINPDTKMGYNLLDDSYIKNNIGETGKELFAFTYKTGFDSSTAQTEDLIAISAVWNYYNIPYGNDGYDHVGNSAGTSYWINLHPVYLNNVYKVTLNNPLTANSNGDYTLDNTTDITNTYQFNSVANSRTEESFNFSTAPFSSFISWNSSFPLVDKYIKDSLHPCMTNYLTNTETNASHDLYNNVYYDVGTVSGDTLSGASNLWIYLANEMEVTNFPAFSSQYFRTVAWTYNDADAFGSCYWNDDYSSELSTNKYGKIYEFTSENKWEYDGSNQSISAFDLNKIQLYYNIGEDYKTYNCYDIGLYGKTITLNITADEEENLTWTPSGEREKRFGGWIFDNIIATVAGYETYFEGGILAVSKNENLVANFSATQINSDFYYVDDINGADSTLPAFEQNASNPIIKARWANLYDLNITNATNYWTKFESDIDNEQLTKLAGVQSHNSESGAITETRTSTQIQIENSDNYAYAFQATNGTAFFHKDDYTDVYQVKSQVGAYYVYSYGQYITDWNISIVGLNANGESYTKHSTITLTKFIFGDSSSSIDLSNLSDKSFATLADAVDDYLLTNRIYTLPTITISPVWEEQNFAVLGENITFGEEYILDTTHISEETGKTLFALSCEGEDLIAIVPNKDNVAGVWNYQNAEASEFTFDGSNYTLQVEGVYVDNIYLVELANVIADLDGEYKLDEGFTFASLPARYDLISILTFLTVEDYFDKDYKFIPYNGQDLMNNYIGSENDSSTDTLHGLKNRFNSGISKGQGNIASSTFSLFEKVFTDDYEDFYIYLANNQAQNQKLPGFKNDLSMTVFWSYTLPTKQQAFITANYDDDYQKEFLVASVDKSNTDAKGVLPWLFYQANPTITAHYVYSVRGYYKYYGTTGDYSSINTGLEGGSYRTEEQGHFGVYTELSLTNNDGSYKDAFKVADTDDQIFDGWIFDKEKANDFNVSDNGTDTLTVTKEGSADSWIFTYSGKNKKTDTLYYITAIQGATRFNQNASDPIIYAKWKTVYDTTIDNTASYWYDLAQGGETNLNLTNGNLYGAHSSDEINAITTSDNNNFTTTIRVADVDAYRYPFMSSESGDTGLSFHRYTDWTSASDGLKATATNGNYYVFNYGHYISGWQILFTHGEDQRYISTIGYYQSGPLTDGLGYTFSSKNAGQQIKVISINDLSSIKISAIAEILDDMYAGSTTKATITLIPVWLETTVNVKTKDAGAGDLFAKEWLTEKLFAGTYEGSGDYQTSTGQSVIAYQTKSGKLIAKNGVWNYMNIPASDYGSYENTYSTIGAGIYTIILNPYFVDNIYQVNLNNVYTYDGNYVLENCDFVFNNTSGTYDSGGKTEFKYTDKIDANYTFIEYNQQTLIDTYIDNILEDLIATYEERISGISANPFDILKKVYYVESDYAIGLGTVSRTDKSLAVENIDNVSFNIYLANNQQTGNLPVFKRHYYSLIFWENENEYESSDYYAYPTAEYDEDSHEDEISNFLVHEDSVGYIWKLEDGYLGNYVVSLKAHYYRKNYKLQISTISDVTNAIERRGYVILQTKDVVIAEGEDGNVSANYVVIYLKNTANPKNSGMAVYKLTSTPTFNSNKVLSSAFIANLYGTNLGNSITLYEGCDVTMKVVDQSKDPLSMNSGRFDDMIGYKFTGEINTSATSKDGTISNKNLFLGENKDDYTFDGYNYTVSAEQVENLEYKNKDVINVDVFYTRIEYNLTIDLNNNNAGSFFVNVNTNDTKGTLYKDYTLENITVHNFYKVYYYAAAGFKLEDNAFVLSATGNTSADDILQSYNEVDKDSVVYLKQDYVITQNYTNDYTFDGTWLRLYFYKYNSSYGLDLNNIGTLTINTCPIEFTYGLKAHDETNIDAVATGNVFETIDDMTKITLNNNGTAKTPNISAHDYNLDEISVNVNEKEYVGIDGTKATFWVYSSNKSNETVVDYVILSTRLYFPSNPTTQEDNFYNAYSFLLTIEPINQAELMSSHLEKMVNTFEHGVIISPENNNRFIYMMFEVRELLTIEMSVAKLDNDDNSTLRTTTLSNGTNNSATLTLTPGATSKTNAATLFETNAEITTYETKKTAYTYVGAINNVYSDFNTAHYARVEYILNNNPTPISNTFDVSENSSLLIKFIPASLNLRYVYTLNGEEITNSEQIGEYIKEGETNSSTAIDYVLGESIMYSAECVDIDYNVNVVINNNSAIENGTTNYTERKVNVVYEITASDFTFGEILVQVNIVLRDNSKIKISYKLNDATKGFADDVYGTFNVYELNKDGEKKIAENVSEVEVSIFDQSSVSVELNINAGYQYESIKYARQDAQKLEIGADGRINIITNYNPETNSGEYVIFISKIPITAVLSTAGTNAKSAYLINNKKALEGLWVGQTIAFTSEPAIQERLDYFYYKAGGNEIPLKDSAGAPLMEVRITSDLLKEVNSTIIDFGVKVVNQYKLTLKVDDDSLQNIAENGLQLKNKTTGETYVAEGAHAYVDANTQITISVQTREPSKYNIDLTMTKPENRENIGSNVVEWKDKEAINEGDVVITLNQDYEYTLVVEPNQYQVIVEENLFNSLDEVFNNNPQEVSAADQVNEITSKGQKYNEEAEISFIKQTEDRELSAIYISNNGNSEIIIIEFNSDNYIAYKIVEDGKQTIRLSDYGYAIELSEDRVIMKYVTYNNIEIRFDYKSYKLIHA